MAKIYVKVGYVEHNEETPGNWCEKIVEKPYFGDLGRNSRRLQPSEGTNNNVVIANDISIIADQYAYGNFHNISYVEFMGAKWKVDNCSVKHPRLLLTLGEIYNV